MLKENETIVLTADVLGDEGEELKRGDVGTTPADYSELGILLITLTAFNLLLPFLAILVVRSSRLRSA